MALQSYRDLDVRQKAMSLAEECYRLTREFPREELFGLTSQIRRAAVSITANIAKGQGRYPTEEFLHHLSIARGFTQGGGDPPHPDTANWIAWNARRTRATDGMD